MNRFTDSTRITEVANLTYAYFAVAYSAAVAILYAPTLLSLLGADAFGLVGLFLTALACFQFIDAAVIPTATRQTARFKRQTVTQTELQHLKAVVQWPIAVTTISATAGILAYSILYGATPTQQSILNTGESLTCALSTMAVIAIRAFAAFDRGVLIGLQRHNTVYTLNIAMSTLRYPLLIALFTTYPPKPTHYFIYHVLISLLELALLRVLARHCVPTAPIRPNRTLFTSQHQTLRFIGIQMAMSFIWLAFTQADKLLLATLLPLAQYGYLTLAVAAASGTTLATAPIAQVLLPRLTILHARNEPEEFSTAYLRAVKISSAISGTLGIWLATFAEPILIAWTGKQDLAHDNWPVLSGYAIGNVFVTLSALCYVSQQAIGKLRLHFLGLTIFAVISLPLLYLSATNYGAIGAAMNWAITNAAFAFLWIRLLHRQFSTSIHRQWMITTMVRTLLPTAILSLALSRLLVLSNKRLPLVFELSLICAVLVITSLMISGAAREFLLQKQPVPVQTPHE